MDHIIIPEHIIWEDGIDLSQPDPARSGVYFSWAKGVAVGVGHREKMERSLPNQNGNTEVLLVFYSK